MVPDSEPRGYWVIDPALAIVILICVGAVFYVGWDYIALETAERVSERYDRENDTYPSDSEIAALCAGRPEPERVQCAINEAEARKE